MTMNSGKLPAGYRIERAQSTGRHASVYWAVRERDGQQVVLKTYPNDTSASRSRALSEYRAFQSVAGGGVPRCLALIEDPPARTLVLERAPGDQLAALGSRLSRSPSELVRVALQLAQILGRIHEGRLLHCDLTPANVLVDPESLEVHVVDLGLARPLGSAMQPTDVHSSVNSVAEGLHFIAPEQTGRMGRGIDYRSDLYTLGATLYYATTGATLFDSDDALGIIHAHMARVPVPPHERRPDVPVALSRIVMKLLEKEPEDRYQTARALEQDLLTCRAQLERTGSIDASLTLGMADLRSRPLFHRRLYGRATELQELREALHRSADKGPLQVVVTGGPGAGKSSLVQALRADVVQRRGHLIAGKFDRYRSARPYAGFTQAIEGLAHQLLVESDESLRTWSERLRSSLGALASVVSGLVPDFAFVLGETEPVPPLGPKETRARLALTVQRLLTGCAAPDRPLVLFLDDCQWADAGSAYLLHEITQDFECPGLLVVTTYRDREADAAPNAPETRHEVGKVDVRIELGPLQLQDYAQMLADALSSENSEDMLSLAEWIARKSGGSPLLAQEFVFQLFETGRIHLKGDRWQWDIAEIRDVEAPEGAVDLLVAKLRRLRPDAREMIEIASLAGDAFDALQIVELTGRPQEAVEPHLFELADHGLLLPDAAGFRFAHDRIREAAQALLGPNAGAELHYRMAWLLEERALAHELPNRALEIADHLLGSDPEALAEERRDRAIQLYLLAGTQCLDAGAGATACRYFAAARKLVREEDWDSERARSFELFLQSAKAAFQAELLDEALDLLSELGRHTGNLLEEAQVASLRIIIQSPRGGADPVGLTIETAARFGFRMTRHPSRWRVTLDLWRTDRALRGPLDERAFRPPQGGGLQRILPTLLVLSAGAPAMMQERAGMVILLLGYSIRALLRHGALRNPGEMLAAYASFRSVHRQDLKGMYRFANAARYWLERDACAAINLRAQLVLQAYVLAWVGSRRDVLEPLRGLVERAKELGDLESRGFLSLYLADYGAFAGEPLSSLLCDFDELRGFLPLGQADLELDKLYRAAYQLLHTPAGRLDEAREQLEDVGSRFESLHRTGAAYWVVGVQWLHVLVLLGRFERASAWAEELLPAAREVGTPGVSVADYLLLRGMSAAAIGRRRPDLSRRLKIARTCLRQLKVWARHAPDCKHMCALLEAELLRLRVRPTRALPKYVAAADAAVRRGFVQYAALAHERRASLLRDIRRDRDAEQALKCSLALYTRWQAHAKTQSLKQHPWA